MNNIQLLTQSHIDYTQYVVFFQEKNTNFTKKVTNLLQFERNVNQKCNLKYNYFETLI